MMELGKYIKLLKGVIMNELAFFGSILFAVVVLIGSITFYKYNELNTMEKNIDTAISKGIDPLAVRCAYANSNDTICVAYAASHQIPAAKSK